VCLSVLGVVFALLSAMSLGLFYCMCYRHCITLRHTSHRLHPAFAPPKNDPSYLSPKHLQNCPSTHHTHPHRNAPGRTAKNETQIEVFVDFFKIRSKIVVKLPIPGLSRDSPCITAPLTPPAHPTGDPRPVTVKYGPPGSQSVLSGLWQPAVLRCVLPAPFQLCESQR
jgi:hypothetical protein